MQFFGSILWRHYTLKNTQAVSPFILKNNKSGKTKDLRFLVISQA